MYWPVILVVIKVTMTPGGISHNSLQDALPTKEECQALLPQTLVEAKKLSWPIPHEELLFLPGCIDVHPEEFFKQHIQTKKPEVKA